MKHGIHILFWMLIAALSSCTDDEIIDVPEPHPQTGIVIRLSAGDLEQTRTDLTSQANLQHVEKVYALLYRGHYKEGQADTTKLIACDELTDWNPEDEGNGGPHGKEYKLPKTENLTQGNYTVLCVGLDDNDEQEVGGSGKTYNLPEAIKNKTLSEAKATLAGGKTKDDIAKSELFAGWNQFHFAPDSLNIVDVEMKRRVAGVICYLTDIPYTITEGSDVYRITRVQLRLFTDQNSSIKLCRDEVITNADGKASYPDDFGESPLSDSQIIDEYILEDKGYNHTTDYTLYQFNLSTNERKLVPNSILMGNYMIPIKFDSQKANQTDNKLIDQVTLQVVLLGKKVDSKEDDPEDTAQEEIVRSFPAINDDIDLEEVTGSDGSVSYEPTKNYPIRPNIIYHIGNKPSDEEEGTPESLAGTEVKIGVKCWESENVDVEFPNVPIELGMQITDVTTPNMVSPFTMLAEGEDSETTPHYIFDCIGSSSLYLIVTPSVQYNKWKVNVTRIDSEGSPITGDDNMIYLKQTWSEDPNVYNYYGTEYPKTYDKEGPIVIPIALTDYAEVNGSSIRRAKITLVGLDEDGNPDNSTTKTMIVEQYNAILVNVGDNENTSYRGFSHFNWHSTRDRLTGEVDESSDGEKVQFGYMDKWQDYIYAGGVNIPADKDGHANYEGAEEKANSDNDYLKDWYESAMYNCAQKGCVVTSKVNYNAIYELKEENAKWYLPSTGELAKFLTDNYNKSDAFISLNEFYWTSFAAGSTFKYAWAYRIDNSGTLAPKYGDNIEYRDYDLYRDKEFYARQCCNIPSESK